MPHRRNKGCGCPGRISRSWPRPGAPSTGLLLWLFVADLLPEVRAAYPEVESAGGRWVDADGLSASVAGATSPGHGWRFS